MSRSLRRTARLSVLLGTAVACALAGAGLTSPAQASRTVTESYPVPADGVFRLSGHGYGHGHGMSQYGALGAARQGLTYRQILSFYYPGTTVGSGAGAIRVLISADTDNDVRVQPATGLRVREVSTGRSWALPTSAKPTVWRLRTVSGKTVLDYHNGSWRTYLPGGKALSGAAEFYGSGSVTLKVAGTTRLYRGALRLAGNDTVNVLGIDDYIRGVVPREMPALWHAQAVRAQAVAARTYAAWERAAHPTRHYQTCDTTSCQVYGGVGAEHSASNAAVDATAGQVLLYGGKPAFTQFGSSSGGWTSAGSMPYLVAKADKYDGHSGNPVHSWTASVTRSAIQKSWPALGTLNRIRITQRDGNGEWYGRVETMVLDGTRSDVTVSGSTFRSRFGLRSQWFRPAGGTTSVSKAETTVSTTTVSPITKRWRKIGGYKSVVRGPRGREYRVGAGRARNYVRGRIYHKAGVGARELHGKVLKVYLRRGATSRLGFPETRPRKFRRGVYANFEKGTIKVFRSGKVRVTYHR